MAVIPAEGTIIASGTTVNGSFTNFAQVISVTPPGGKVNVVDTTTLTGTVKTGRPGRMPDPGEAKVKIQYDPNTNAHVTLRGLVYDYANNTQYYKVTYPDSNTNHATTVFQAILTDVSPNDLADEVNNELDLTFKLIAAPIHTAGS